MLVIISFTFCLFWIAYRHNYYFVQRNKIDTHGLLFNNALSQLFAGVYVLEIALVGLFFLVRDTDDHVACSSQAIIMIVVLIITAIFHFVMEQHLRPLYEFIPVTLEDSAVDAERERFLIRSDDELPSTIDSASDTKQVKLGTASALDLPFLSMDPARQRARAATDASTLTAASARHALAKVRQRAQLSPTSAQAYNKIPPFATSNKDADTADRKATHRRAIADQLGTAISSYPDELTDLSPEELNAELKAAFQDPVTREPRPVIWIPEDDAGFSKQIIHKVDTLYGGSTKRAGHEGTEAAQPTQEKGNEREETERQEAPFLVYSSAGASLARNGKVQVTQPAPDIRADWCLEWEL